MQAVSTLFDFALLKKGMRGRVVASRPENAEGRRLAEMGLTEGAEFQVVKVAPFGDPIEINLRGYRLCLRKAESRHIQFTLVD